MKKEAKEREEEKRKKNLEELKKQLLQEKLNNLKSTPIGAKALEGIAPEVCECSHIEGFIRELLKKHFPCVVALCG